MTFAVDDLAQRAEIEALDLFVGDLLEAQFEKKFGNFLKIKN